MKQLFIITGAMGVGKTTVGKRLSDRLGRAAFIDGDWCLDIHPFVGNKETKSMAIDNIIYMIKNYSNCSECDSIVLSWIMSENTISRIIDGISSCNLKTHSITLICDETALRERWTKDTVTEWRNDEELNNSLRSLDDFNHRQNTYLIDTGNITVDAVVDKIINYQYEMNENIKLEPLDADNWLKVCDLSVDENQKSFFPISNVYWIAISRYEEKTELFAIKAGDEYVGLIGGGFDEDGITGYINPIMIDKCHQRKGYAKHALQLMITYLRNQLGVQKININHRKENIAAAKIYESMGFFIYNETEKEYQRQLKINT